MGHSYKKRKVSQKRYLTYLAEKSVWGIGFMIVGLVIFFGIGTATIVSVESEEGLVFLFPIEKGEEFEVHYLHSVEKTEVIEVFKINATNEMMLIRTEQESYGAGLPTESLGEFRKEGNRYIFDEINHVLQKVDLRVGKVAEHRIITPLGKKYRLLDFVNSGTRVSIAVKKVSRMRLWFY